MTQLASGWRRLSSVGLSLTLGFLACVQSAHAEGDFGAIQVVAAIGGRAPTIARALKTTANDPQAVSAAGDAGTILPAVASTDYPVATWIPAAPSNFSVADRPTDYPIDMIVIHDIEGSASTAIKMFQNPTRHGSANYIVSYAGGVWQMVLEKDIAWHAGNWDYNTRSIGIEHEGYAWTPGLYTKAEYRASAHLAASICSRWGVPMDRAHVIGHSQVPDPFHHGLFGGDSHHTDPGPYWSWTTYMSLAQYYASVLPSPPHMVMDARAVAGDGTATVTWDPARSCHNPITGYRVVLQPGNVTLDLPGTATTATFTGLQNGMSYSFTVTAINSSGQDSLQSNSVVPGQTCTSAGVSVSPASPQALGAQVQFVAVSTGCPDPRYAYWLEYPNGSRVLMQAFAGDTWSWDTAGFLAGTYKVQVWANHNTSDYSRGQALADITYTLTGCTSASLTPAPSSFAVGSVIAFSATAGGCPKPEFEFWVRRTTGQWVIAQGYSSTPTFGWKTSALARGNYQVAVWVKQDGSGTPTYEAGAGGAYVLAGCSVAALSPAPGTYTIGEPIALLGSAPGCPNAQYEFWVRPPEGLWRMTRPYSLTSSFSWSTTGLAAGTYQIALRVRQAGSAAPYEAGTGGAYTLKGCTAASLAPSPGTFTAGSVIDFTAIGSGCTSPEYEFWVLWPGGHWSAVQGYGSNPAFSWKTAGLAIGSYQVSVWVRQHGSGTATYDVGAGGTYTITG
jgi:N-acetylmuramoyl-L-alanine amidase